MFLRDVSLKGFTLIDLEVQTCVGKIFLFIIMEEVLSIKKILN